MARNKAFCPLVFLLFFFLHRRSTFGLTIVSTMQVGLGLAQRPPPRREFLANFSGPWWPTAQSQMGLPQSWRHQGSDGTPSNGCGGNLVHLRPPSETIRSRLGRWTSVRLRYGAVARWGRSIVYATMTGSSTLWVLERIDPNALPRRSRGARPSAPHCCQRHCVLLAEWTARRSRGHQSGRAPDFLC